MSCNLEGCTDDVQFLLDSNLVKQYFCGSHGLDHKKKTGQLLKLISDEESEKIVFNFLKPKIETCIMKMKEETNDLIEILKKSSFLKINSLKAAALSSKSIVDWTSIGYHTEMITFLLDEAKNISDDIEIFTPRKIEQLNKEISSIRESCDKKIKEIEKNVYKTEKLQKILDEKTEKEVIPNKEILNQILENLKKQEIEKQNFCKGYDYLEFSNKSLEQKKDYVMNNWAFIDQAARLDEDDCEFLLTIDGKYLFRCNF